MKITKDNFFKFLNETHKRVVKMGEENMPFEYFGRADHECPDRGHSANKVLLTAEQLLWGSRDLLFHAIDSQYSLTTKEEEAMEIIGRRLIEVTEVLIETQKLKDFIFRFWIERLHRERSTKKTIS